MKFLLWDSWLQSQEQSSKCSAGLQKHGRAGGVQPQPQTGLPGAQGLQPAFPTLPSMPPTPGL